MPLDPGQGKGCRLCPDTDTELRLVNRSNTLLGRLMRNLKLTHDFLDTHGPFWVTDVQSSIFASIEITLKNKQRQLLRWSSTNDWEFIAPHKVYTWGDEECNHEIEEILIGTKLTGVSGFQRGLFIRSHQPPKTATPRTRRKHLPIRAQRPPEPSMQNPPAFHLSFSPAPPPTATD